MRSRTAAPAGSYASTHIPGHPVVRAVWRRTSTGHVGTNVHVVARTSHSVVVHEQSGDVSVEHRRLGERSDTALSERAVGFVCHPWIGVAVVDRLKRATERSLARQVRPSAEGLVEDVLRWNDCDAPFPDVRGVLLAIEANPTRRGLREASAASGMSARTLRRRVRAATGVSPDQFRVIARAATARRRLLSDDAPLAEVAYRLGYADQSHLHREFVSLCGYTPLEWRRRRDSWTTTGP